MSAGVLERLDRLIRQPHGIVLVTGPTGSGKTTTLYAALSRLDASTSNILTVEDPIEYDLPGISQTQVNAKIDMSFALALRAILRQDPDVIMIGEIRDLETAQIAVQASLTGHLVLATLHTNDAVSAVTRLTDMGVEPLPAGLVAAGRAGPAPGVSCARPASSRPNSRAAASTIRSAAPPQPHRLQRPLGHPRAVQRGRRGPPSDPRGPRRARTADRGHGLRHAQHAGRRAALGG